MASHIESPKAFHIEWVKHEKIGEAILVVSMELAIMYLMYARKCLPTCILINISMCLALLILTSKSVTEIKENTELCVEI